MCINIVNDRYVAILSSRWPCSPRALGVLYDYGPLQYFQMQSARPKKGLLPRWRYSIDGAKRDRRKTRPLPLNVLLPTAQDGTSLVPSDHFTLDLRFPVSTCQDCETLSYPFSRKTATKPSYTLGSELSTHPSLKILSSRNSI